jgi:hypothetical protein
MLVRHGLYLTGVNTIPNHKPMATAYVVQENVEGKSVYFLPRMDMWLTIEHVRNSKFTGTNIELRSARQSEMRMAEGKPKKQISSIQTFRCALDTLNDGVQIFESGFDLTQNAVW